MKGGDRILKAYDTGPSLVDIRTLRDLRELLGKPRRNVAFVDAANFQGDYLALDSSRVLKEPVCVFLALHAANDAPCPMQMGHSQRHRLSAVFRDPVVVMLVNLVQVSSWPRKETLTQDSLQVERHRDSGRVTVPLQCERRPPHHYGGKIGRQPRVHLPQLLQIDLHTWRL